jgi:hypothetical protein
LPIYEPGVQEWFLDGGFAGNGCASQAIFRGPWVLCMELLREVSFAMHFVRLREYSGWFWLPGRGLMAWSR